MKIHHLISLMRKIARQLVHKAHQTDFELVDVDNITPTNGEVRFIWQLRHTGTNLYLYTEQGWEERLLENINYFCTKDISNIYYLYNKKKLIPIFKNEVRHLAIQRIRARNKTKN